MRIWLAIVTLWAVLWAPPALAWGTDGHRIVGALADQLLAGSRAEQQVRALLLPGETLESIANWLDCAKAAYCGPQTAEMKAYTEANPSHAQYHYTDIPFQQLQYRDGGVGSGPYDVVQTLKQAILVLQGTAGSASNPHHFSRREALLLITHLAGDIHQPLHVGVAYISENGRFVLPLSAPHIDGIHIFDTRGGNDLLLDDGTRPSAARPLSLHLYWDIMAVEAAMAALPAATPQHYARSVITAEPRISANAGAPVTWPDQWADQALQVAKLAYADIEPGQRSVQTSRKGAVYSVWPVRLPPTYSARSAALAATQLTQGGYHLAALLRAIWP